MPASTTVPLTLFEIIIIDYRWILVCFILLPLSFIYNFLYYIRARIIFHLNSAPKNHVKRVGNIQKQVREWQKTGGKQQMCTSRPGWQTMSFRRPLYKTTSFQIDCNLVDILDIDVNNRIVRCEPMVTMGQLSEQLSKLGWTIPILPELDDLTVGGLVMGTGIESSSHAYGLFQHICVSYELVLADGSCVTCSKDNNPDLFYSIPWSYGTLGLLTAVDIQIIPATKYIRLKYETITGLANISKRLNDVCLNGQAVDFVEGLMYSLNEAVVMTGVMVEDKDVESDKINAIGNWYKPWFYTHCRSIMEKKKTVTEYIPLRDYYHRHSRSIFWELHDIVPFGNNVVFRYLLGWLMPLKISLLKLTQTAPVKKLYENNHIIQDMLVPITKLETCVEAFEKSVKVYPIWLCPFKLYAQPGMLQPKDNQSQLYVDIGVYGVPKVNNFQPEKTTRYLENVVFECSGFQMLYADTYMTRDEFRRMFNHKLYDRMRSQLNCKKAFPEVYDKVNKNVRT